MNTLQQTIAELVEQRSHALHTGNTAGANAATKMLMLAWSQLPDNTPDPLEIIMYNGVAYILQSQIGANYKYVLGELWDRKLLKHAPTDRQTRILTELHMNEQAHSEIEYLDAVGIDPISEGDEPDNA